MKLIYLPFDCVWLPHEFRPIEAYSNGNEIVIPIGISEEERHSCDVNGCSSLSHVRRFKLEEATQLVWSISEAKKRIQEQRQ